MDFLSDSAIREKFNHQKTAALNEEQAQALRHLSTAVFGLQGAGLPVSLELTGWCGEDSFKNVSNASAAASGILTIGHGRFALTLMTKDKEKDCLQLHLSYYDMNLGALDNRTYSYDLRGDSQAMVKFQEHVIFIAGRYAAVQENDIADAFALSSLESYDTTPKLKKPGGSGGKFNLK